MPLNKSADNLLSDVEQIARVWTDNPTFALGDITCKNLNLTLQTMAFGQDLSDSKGSTAKPAQEKT